MNEGLKFVKTEEDIIDPKEEILDLLRSKKFPTRKDVFLAELEETVGWSITKAKLDYYVDRLIDEGYDIKDIADEIVLVRYSVDSIEDYYRPLGEIETPCIFASDEHMGSKTFTELAYKKLLDDIEEFSVRDVLIAGDLFQGRGVHRMELQDVKLMAISDQINFVSRKLNMMPKGTILHTVIGNHGEKIKGSIEVGLDVYDAMTPRLASKITHRYYGHVALLTLNRDYDLLMLHGSGGMSYAISYKVQKIDRQLVERPNILYTGHLHQLYSIPRPASRMYVMGGTMQRENAYLISKGITSQVGYLILEKFDETGSKVMFRTPRTW